MALPYSLPLPSSLSSSLLLSPAPLLDRSRISLLPSPPNPRNLVLAALSASQAQGYPQAESPPDPSWRSPTSKKRRKQKPRPSFYDQTLERWSVRIPSQRSTFPWQEKQSGEEKGRDSSQLPLSSAPSFPRIEEHCAPPSIEFGSSKGSEVVKVEARTLHPNGHPEFIGEKVNSNLNSIIEKLNFSFDRSKHDLFEDGLSLSSEDAPPNSSVKQDGKPSINKVASFPLASRSMRAPWVHGAKPTWTQPKNEDWYEKSKDNFESDLKDKGPGADLMAGKPPHSLDLVKSNGNSDHYFGISNSKEGVRSLSDDKSSSSTKPVVVPSGDSLMVPLKHQLDYEVASLSPVQNNELNEESGQSTDSPIIAALTHSLVQKCSVRNNDTLLNELNDEYQSDSEDDMGMMMGSVLVPWERESNVRNGNGLYSKSNTEQAERSIPEPELRRLRNVSLRMKGRMEVGPAGLTQAVVESIHEKWKEDEVVKLRFEGPPSLNMKRAHEILEIKTGGLVIWRSGKSLVLYRGMSYKLPCVQSYTELVNADSVHDSCNLSIITASNAVKSSNEQHLRILKTPISTDTSDIESLLDQLGPRFKDWSGRNPVPVDADLLPGVVSGYKPPFRLLPYKTRSTLTNREMTSFRRLARSMPPHFALGRNRQHQGLAIAIVKLWDKSALAKIAIKRGVPNTCNERMAEEIKKLTGGVLLSRNKEYIVFYRGNDFLTPSVREVLIERQQKATLQQDEEEARLRSSASISSSVKAMKRPALAGTLAETMEAKSRWGNPLSSKDIDKAKSNLALAKHASLVRFLERKLFFAKAKIAKAEKALAKVQEFLIPAELPTDLETVTDEERSIFRNIGLKMRAFLLLGRRGVFDGTVQNMHLNWKHKEIVKVIVKGKNFAQVKHIAISLEAESGGVLISLDKTTKGYAIIMYRGKNYQRPQTLRPKNLLTRRQALARSIELQRREALKHHITNLQDRIQMLKSQLDQMRADKEMQDRDLVLQVNNVLLTNDDNVEDEGEEAYLETYSGGGGNEDAAAASEDAF